MSKNEHEALLGKISELEALKDKMMRTAADFENAKKRLQREKDEFVKFSQESFLRNLLPVLDNFERALLHSDEQDEQNLKGVLKGVQLLLKQFQDILKSQGLVRLETKEKPFDPHYHEAIAYVQEEGEADQVVEEIEPGYMLHDRLLRAAKVRVRMNPTEAAKDASGQDEKEDEIT